MGTSENGLNLIMSFEGCKLQAYPDPATGGDPYTVGFGHTGDDVQPGEEITQEEAEMLLQEDVRKLEVSLDRVLTGEVTQGQFDALVCFAYNVGFHNLSTSTLLRLTNAGDKQGAAQQFLRWNRAGGRVMAGLTRRRTAEMNLFLS